MLRSAAVLALLLLRPTPGGAHAVGMSRGEYRADGAVVRAELVFARKELATTLPDVDADADGELTSAELERAAGILSRWIDRGIVVRVPAGPCRGRLERAIPTEQDGVELEAVYACPAPAASFSIRVNLFDDLSLGHRHLLTAVAASQTVRTALYAAEPEVDLGPQAAAASASVAPSLFRLGVEHILTGYDHLLFLLAVVLIGGPLRAILGVITAFTLAHSVTLAVAASGLWTPRPTLVEPAIALSIAYVGIENCVAPDVRKRWRLTFLFGLVHGFGFAGALRELAFSAAQLPVALASFNVGVEAGQLAVLAIVLPCVTWLGGRAWFARGGVRLASITISAVGFCWFVLRVSDGLALR